MTNLDSVLKSKDITFPIKVCIVKPMVFPLVMYRCVSWIVKKAECQRIDAFKAVVLDKTLASPLDSKELKPVYIKENQPWILISRTDAEAETQVLWLPYASSWFIGKDPDAGKDWRQKVKRVADDEMGGWHHWCNVHALGWTLGDVEGHGGLACCSSWGPKKWTQLSDWIVTTKIHPCIYHPIWDKEHFDSHILKLIFFCRRREIFVLL